MSFSATMPMEAKKLAHKYMKAACYIDVAEKAVASTVEQRVYETTKTRKYALLLKHLEEFHPYLAVVFVIPARALMNWRKNFSVIRS